MFILVVLLAIYALFFSPLPVLVWVWYRVFTSPAASQAQPTRAPVIATALLPTFCYVLPVSVMFLSDMPLLSVKAAAEATWVLWFLWGCVMVSAAAAVVSARLNHPVRLPLVVASVVVAFVLSLLIMVPFLLFMVPHQ